MIIEDINPTEIAVDEYKSLREEILAKDNACMLILGALVTASGGLLAFLFKSNNIYPQSAFALAGALLVQILWIFGFIYIGEKRIMIRKIAGYLRTIEGRLPLGWECYVNNFRIPGRPRLGWSPFYVEMAAAITISFCNVLLVFDTTLRGCNQLIARDLILLIFNLISFFAAGFVFCKYHSWYSLANDKA